MSRRRKLSDAAAATPTTPARAFVAGAGAQQPHAGGVMAITVRLPVDLFQRLQTAMAQRRLENAVPSSQQDIVRVALDAWLSDAGH